VIAPGVERIERALARHEPRTVRRADRRAAATALVLSPDADDRLRLLAVERAERRGDPWSGQMALPGGRREPGDRSLLETARRETYEETGLELTDPIGRLDDVGSRVGGVVVSTWVFALDGEPRLRLAERELVGSVHVPLDHLRSEAAATTYRYLGVIPFPAYRYRGRVIWGLTYRTVRGFLAITGGGT
jgi:8-oxo-dGTP pyrophosphatase MutT (NUDIX family)